MQWGGVAKWVAAPKNSLTALLVARADFGAGAITNQWTAAPHSKTVRSIVANEASTSPTSQRARQAPWWSRPHLLSLEAPVVAVVWQEALAQYHRIDLMPAVSIGLGLVVWLIYVTDRLLDAIRGDPAKLDPRHAFYRRNWRWFAWVLIPAASLAALWLAVWAIPEDLMWQCAALGVMVAVYLGACSPRPKWKPAPLTIAFIGLGTLLFIAGLPASAHLKLVLSVAVLLMMVMRSPSSQRLGAQTRLPKELIASLLFTLGCTAAVHFFTVDDGLAELVAETTMMWAVIFANMTGIACVERHHREDNDDPNSIACRWPGIPGRYPWLVMGLMLVAIGFAMPAAPFSMPRSTILLARSVGGSAVLLGLLWWRRAGLSPLSYRILADAAIVLPVSVVWLISREP